MSICGALTKLLTTLSFTFLPEMEVETSACLLELFVIAHTMKEYCLVVTVL